LARRHRRLRRGCEHAPELVRSPLGTGRHDDVRTGCQVLANDALSHGTCAARNEDAVSAQIEGGGAGHGFSRRVPLGARADFAVLAALDEYGALSQAELGRRLGLDRNDVNGILNRVQGRGHVGRQADPADRRRNVVTLTAAGHKQLEELQRHADAVQDELLEGLNATERRQLHSLLGKLLDSHKPQPA
jgi:DNA-binding MarR family transcriptional regulator